MVLYLYQIGFFGQQFHQNPGRQQQQQQQQQQPPPQQQQQDLIRQQVDEVRQAAGGGDVAAGVPQEEDAIHQEPAEVVQPEMTSPNYLSVVATFVTSFFSSLIPHDPQVV